VQRTGIAILLVVGIGALVWVLRGGPLSQAQNRGPTLRAGGSAVFTPAHKNLSDTVKEFIEHGLVTYGG